MDGDKDDKSFIEKTVDTVKDLTNSMVAAVTPDPPERSVVPSEPNFDAGPMTADEIARRAAADTQPVAIAKGAKRKQASRAKKVTPLKKVANRPKKAVTKKSAKKSAKKTTKKTAPKKRKAAKSSKMRPAKKRKGTKR
jgi:hypothetical protein